MSDVLPIKFKIGPVALQTQEADCRIVTKKEIRHIRYGATVPDDGVGIAYVGLPEISEDNIFLKDLSRDTVENSDLAAAEYIVNANEFDTPFGEILVTDLTKSVPTQQPIPLYYKHDLSVYTSVTEVRVFNKNQEEVDESFWHFDTTTRIVYHNLPSSHDRRTGVYESFTVSFVDQTLQRQTLLLKADTAYKAHDLAVDGLIDPTKRTYNAQDTGANFHITINFAAPVAQFYVKGLEGSQVRAVMPAETGPGDSWHMRFTNGEVYATKNGGLNRYHVPEWGGQVFAPVQPLRYSAFKEADVVANRLIRTKRWPLRVDTNESRWVDILVTDELGRPKRAYTNNSARTVWLDSAGNPTAVETEQISAVNVSFNEAQGFIKLDRDLSSTDKVWVNYYYEEKYLEYLGYNFNPIYNNAAVDERVIMYVRHNVPNGVANQAVHHISFNQTDLTFIATSDALLPVIADYQAWLDNSRDFMVVASVDVARRAAPIDVVTIDTRVEGGGLKEDIDPKEYYATYPEIGYFAGIGNLDGRAFPGQATSLIELPHTLLTGKGSLALSTDRTFTDAEIKEIVKRHMALGSYPIIKWYGHIPIILTHTHTAAVTTSATFTWSAVAGATGYSLYWTYNLDHPFTLGVTTAAGILTGTVTGLSNGIAYFYVVPIFNGNEGLKSDIVRINSGKPDPAAVVVLVDAVLSSRTILLTTSVDACLDFCGGVVQLGADAVLT